MAKETSDLGAPNAGADWEALARYLAGESSDVEAHAVRRWLEAHPANAKLVAALDRTISSGLSVAPVTADIDVESALNRVKARRDNPGVIPISSARPSRSAAAERASARPAARWRVALPAAAAAVLLAGILWQTTRSRDETVVPTPARSVATAVGQRDSVRLPDGTRIVLGPNSRLVVAEGYGNARRDVELSGEAYFHVEHDAARPFVVRAGFADVQDIGTAFTVRNDGGVGVSVVVTEGSVMLRASAAGADSGVLLRAGDAGAIVAGGRPAARRGAASDDDLAWMTGRLVFRDAPMARVGAELRRWYGIELRVADSALARRTLTASYGGESVERVLSMIGLALGADVERRGDTAVVRSRRVGRP